MKFYDSIQTSSTIAEYLVNNSQFVPEHKTYLRYEPLYKKVGQDKEPRLTYDSGRGNHSRVRYPHFLIAIYDESLDKDRLVVLILDARKIYLTIEKLGQYLLKNTNASGKEAADFIKQIYPSTEIVQVHIRHHTELRESSPWKMSEVKLDLNAIALDLLDFCGGDPRKLDKAIHGGAFIKNYKPDQIKEIVGKASIIVQIAREFAEEGADDEFAESVSHNLPTHVEKYLIKLIKKDSYFKNQKVFHIYWAGELPKPESYHLFKDAKAVSRLGVFEDAPYSDLSAPVEATQMDGNADYKLVNDKLIPVKSESAKLQESAFVVDEGGDDLDIQEYTNELKKLGFSFAGGIMWQKRVEKNDKVMYLKIAVQVGSDAGYRIEYSVDSQPLSARKGGGPYRPDPEAKKIEAYLKKSPYTQTNDDHYDMSYDQIFGMNKQDAVKFLVNTAKAAIKIVESKI